MKIDIRRDAHKGKIQQQCILLDERLPAYINKPVNIQFDYEIEHLPDYYLLKLEEQANIELICQRCSDIWQYDYSNTHEIAVFNNDKNVEIYASSLDVIVCPDLILDIKEILLDNMHLFVPEKHEYVDQCNQDQLKLFSND